MSSRDVVRAAAAALVAEIVWHGTEGFGAVALTPLVTGDAVAVALTYDRRALAEALASCETAVLVLSDPRLAGRAWSPQAVPVRVDLHDDRDGERFAADLLDQELRKHPPSRDRLDSPLLRREHWWLLPRWIAALRPIAHPTPLAARADGTGGVLAVTGGAGLHVDTVAIDDWNDDRVPLRSLSDRGLPDGAGVVFGHDFSVPDRERTASALLGGQVSDGTLRVAQRHGSRSLPAPLGLRARLRAERQLARACRRALRDAPQS